MSNKFSMDRRSFVAGGLAAFGAVLASPQVIAALSRGSSSSAGATSGGPVDWPTYVKFAGPTPDVPGTAEGVFDGFTKYPTDLVTSVSEAPGTGGDVTAALLRFGAPPVALDQNAYWQEFNKRLNINFKPILVNSADWLAKINTIIAGGDLPDFIQLWGDIPNMVDFVTAECQDLSEYLSGDAVKKYPNLANIPTYAWQKTRIAGRLYGLPQDRGPFTAGLYIQQNLAEDAGIPQPKNTDEFTELMKALTRPDDGTWGMGSMAGTTYNIAFFDQLFGVPNGWSVDDSGKFTKDIETEEAKAAVDYARSLFAEGVFHPDSNAMTADQAFPAYIGGSVASLYDGFSSYDYYWQQTQAVNPDFQVRIVVPFGSDAVYYTGAGTFSVTAMKQADPERIEELLQIANYLAAPFGTTENLFLVNGVKDVHYTLDDNGSPVLTQRGEAEAAPGLSQDYITSAPRVQIDTQYPDFVTTVNEQSKALLAIGVADPTLTLYSPTYSSQVATLGQLVSDRVSAIIAGRASISDFDGMVDDWRSAGGDQSRAEFEQSYQDQG